MRKKPLNLCMDVQTRRQLSVLAKKERRSMSEQVSKLIDDAWRTSTRETANQEKAPSFNAGDYQHSAHAIVVAE
jgi:macrodomain Ter protein organizer (MatP/YcbG family)